MISFPRENAANLSCLLGENKHATRIVLSHWWWLAVTELASSMFTTRSQSNFTIIYLNLRDGEKKNYPYRYWAVEYPCLSLSPNALLFGILVVVVYERLVRLVVPKKKKKHFTNCGKYKRFLLLLLFLAYIFFGLFIVLFFF